MSIIDNLNKDEAMLVVEELGLTVPESSKIIDLRDIIEKSDKYSNEQLMKDIVKSVLEEYKSRKEAEKTKLELEQIKLAQLEKELEIGNIRNEPSQNSEFEKIKLTQLDLAKVRRGSRENLPSSTYKFETGIGSNKIKSFIKSVKTLTIQLSKH